MATYIRCKECRHFFAKVLSQCDKCGTERNSVNPHLYTAKVNAGLYAQAERADPQREKAEIHRAAREYVKGAL